MSKKTVKTKTSSKTLRLVLASGSPYRRQLLERLGLPFISVTPEVDESPLPRERPAETAVRLAEAKARAVGANYPDALVIGSDQIAEFAGAALGKPRDPADALEQLRAMRGRTAVFHTAIALLNTRSDRCQSALVDVVSTFRSFDDTELKAYLERDRPFDCAGSVKAETLGIALFTRLASDDPTALIGLPLIRLTDMLAAEGVSPLHRK
jgi:septum formation protein